MYEFGNYIYYFFSDSLEEQFDDSNKVRLIFCGVNLSILISTGQAS